MQSRTAHRYDPAQSRRASFRRREAAASPLLPSDTARLPARAPSLPLHTLDINYKMVHIVMLNNASSLVKKTASLQACLECMSLTFII